MPFAGTGSQIYLIVAMVTAGAGLAGCADCGRSEPSESARTPEPTRTPAPAPAVERDDAGFLYARVDKHSAAVPARFGAGLPTTLRAFDGDWSAFPPQGQVSAALCVGDAGMFARWVQAIADAASAGQLSSMLRERYLGLVEGCDDRTRFCAQVRDHAPKATPSVHRVLVRALSLSCEDPGQPPAGSGGRRPAGSAALPELVRDPDFDAAGWEAAHPKRNAELRTELGVCARDPEAMGSERARCLRSLATVDRDQAEIVARALEEPSEPPPELRTLIATLALFPSTAALHRAMKRWGLLDATPSPSAAAEPAAPITVQDILRASGRIHVFDMQAGVPVQHDVLLTQLAEYAGDALRGAVFEELPPPLPEGRFEPYVLRAYAGGQVFQAGANNNGDRYDLHAVIGLLNAGLRELGSDFRYRVVGSEGRRALVLGASRAGIARAIRLGLLDPQA